MSLCLIGRSPFSNKYYPKVEEAVKFPTELMRNMEININKYLEGYLKHYYSNGMSTTYAFEKETMGQYHVIILCKNSILQSTNRH